MKYFLTSLFFFTLCNLNAQYVLQGTVVDDQNLPLPGASVVVSAVADSAMVAFGMANADGDFKIDIEEEAPCYAQFSFIGFKTMRVAVPIVADQKSIDMGAQQLQPSTVAISEVEVSAERIPMGILGDTIVYDAAAFHVQDGASVEDLLRQMPGIEIDRDGNIKAQGEDVKNVLVDGKEFFGGNVKIATKNLDAEAVSTVEVFDKKSEIAEFTGVDDGQEEKTINLELKEDHKKGGFGRAQLAAGTENTYLGKFNYNRFNPTTQLSFIGNSNNMNQQAFSINDYMDFMGGLSNMAAFGDMSGDNGVFTMGGQGQKRGISTAHVLGTNLNHAFGSRLSFNASYFLSNDLNKLSEKVKAQNFDQNRTFSTEDERNSRTNVQSHKVRTKLKWKKSPFLEWTMSNNFSLNRDKIDAQNVTDFIENSTLKNRTRQMTIRKDRKFGLNTKIVVKKRWEKKGRNWLVNAGNSVYTANEERSLNNSISAFTINQRQDFSNYINSQQFGTSYTEPLSKKYFLSFNYNFDRSLNTPERLFYTILDTQEQLDENLSGNFERLVLGHRAGVSLRRNSKKLKLSGKVDVSQINLMAGGLNRDFTFILPSATLKWALKGSRNFDMNYYTGITLPTLSQLITIPNNLDPNRQYLGNIDLIPEVNQKIGAGYNFFDSFNFSSLFINVSIEKTQNKIVDQTIINADLTTTATPINSDFYESGSAFSDFSFPVKPLKIKLGISGDISLRKYNAWLNEEATRVGEQTYALGVRVENKKKAKWDGQMGVRFNWTGTQYTVNPAFNQKFANYDWYADLSINLTDDLVWKSSYTMRQFNNVFFSAARQLHIVDTSVRKSFKKGKWAVSLSCNDILNQTQGISRSATANSLRDETFNTRARIILVGVSMKLGKKKA